MSGKRILAGFHAVTARLRAAPDSIERLYVDARRRDGRMQRLRPDASAAGIEVQATDAERLRSTLRRGTAPGRGGG